MMIKALSIASICLSIFQVAAQKDTLKIQKLDQVDVNDNRVFKRIGLYDETADANGFSIRGFNQLDIFSNDMSDEVWFSKNTSCINVKLKEDAQNTFLNVKWNKDQDGCDWVGLGFGWDFWTAKDMGGLNDTIALELEVRSTEKNLKNLPLAFGFEDYTGKQSWLGFSKNFVQNKEITQAWTKVTIPFSLFPFEENDFEMSSMKQLIIQFFAEGEFEINAIKIVPFSGKLKLETAVPSTNRKIQIDGDLSEWKQSFTTFGENQKFAVMQKNDSLFMAFQITDQTPRVNKQTGNNLWNGDAIEIAFSTNQSSSEKRKFLLMSDNHIGINCGANPYVWNWKNEEILTEVAYKIKGSSNGYSVEMAIPFKDLYKTSLVSGMTLGFEIAVDLSGSNELRGEQQRWNSSDKEGFHTNPSVWGKMIIE